MYYILCIILLYDLSSVIHSTFDSYTALGVVRAWKGPTSLNNMITMAYPRGVRGQGGYSSPPKVVHIIFSILRL